MIRYPISSWIKLDIKYLYNVAKFPFRFRFIEFLCFLWSFELCIWSQVILQVDVGHPFWFEIVKFINYLARTIIQNLYLKKNNMLILRGDYNFWISLINWSKYFNEFCFIFIFLESGSQWELGNTFGNPAFAQTLFWADYLQIFSYLILRLPLCTHTTPIRNTRAQWTTIGNLKARKFLQWYITFYNFQNLVNPFNFQTQTVNQPEQRVPTRVQHEKGGSQTTLHPPYANSTISTWRKKKLTYSQTISR